MGGGDELSFRFIVLLLNGLFCVFTVMSEYSLDEPGFKSPGALVPVPPSSDSSVEAPSDGRRKCIACPRRMSKKTADRHTLCINCRGFDCDINNRCEECLEWPEEEVKLYAKYHKSLKSKDSSSKSKTTVPPPPSDSRPSPQPSPRDDLQPQVDSLSVTVNSLTKSLSERLDAFMASFITQSSHLSSQPRLGPDVEEPQPGVTAGESCTFQALGVPNGTPLVPPMVGHPFGQGFRALASEQLGSATAPPSQPAPPPQPLRHLLTRLCVLRIHLLNPPLLVGFRLALRPLVTVVTPIHHRSRRPARRKAMSPSETPLLLVWQTLFMRSARTLVH